MALPTFVSVGAVSGSSAGSNPGTPASSVAGDLWLLFVHTVNQNCPTPTGPTDWALVTTPTGTGPAGGIPATRLTVWWRRATGSDPATAIGDSGSFTIGRIAAFRGVSASDPPFEILGANVLSSASATITIPGGTTLGADRLVVAACSTSTDGVNGSQVSGEANADLANLTEIIDSWGSGGNGGGFVVYTGEKAAVGSVGATTATAANSAVQERLSLGLLPTSDNPPEVHQGAAAFTASGTLTAAAARVRHASANFTASGNLTALAARVRHASATFDIETTMTAAAALGDPWSCQSGTSTTWTCQ